MCSFKERHNIETKTSRQIRIIENKALKKLKLNYALEEMSEFLIKGQYLITTFCCFWAHLPSFSLFHGVPFHFGFRSFFLMPGLPTPPPSLCAPPFTTQRSTQKKNASCSLYTSRSLKPSLRHLLLFWFIRRVYQKICAHKRYYAFFETSTWKFTENFELF